MSTDHDIDGRLAFMGLTQEDRASLREIKPLIGEHLPKALEAFYARVQATPAVARLFGDAGRMKSAQTRQESHWDLIARADFGDAYVQGVKAVGHVHARIGLEPRWYIGGYAMILERLLAALIAENMPRSRFGGRPDPAQLTARAGALVKAVLLDMDYAISVYIDAAEAARRAAEAEVLERTQREVVEAFGAALRAMADGDLTYQVEQEVAAAFSGLKSDLNGASGHLREAIANVVAGVETINTSADEIAVAADDLSRRTEQQAASLEETAAALDEVTATVAHSAEGARTAAGRAEAARRDAARSGVVMGEAVAAMGEIESSSAQIGQIIGVIDEIAFQTNLLALNAGVEAARAGDAGRGFAVVAQEVRALAQRSAEAAKDIKSLITASSEQVARGARLVTETGDALDDIVASVVEIDGLLSAIARSAQEQATGLAQVNTAVNQMDQVTQQNAAMVEQATAAAAAMKTEAARLAASVHGFRVGAKAATPARAVPARSEKSVRQVQAELGRRVANGGWEEF